MHIESSPRSDITPDTEECDLEDFGAKLERCQGKDFSSKDSPSKHKKLFSSLRSLRSLTNLHSSPTKTNSKTKQPLTPRSESPVKHLVRVNTYFRYLQCADYCRTRARRRCPCRPRLPFLTSSSRRLTGQCSTSPCTTVLCLGPALRFTTRHR